MSLNKTPRSNRPHVAIFGKRNVGKSSIINAITGQKTSLVSPIKGTTTDPVYKSMELLPVGPIVLIDTAGLDDEGELGVLRKEKTIKVLNQTDLALIVIDTDLEITEFDKNIVKLIKEKDIPLIGIINKADKQDNDSKSLELSNNYQKLLKKESIIVSAINQIGISKIKKAIVDVLSDDNKNNSLIGDIISQGDIVVLVIPIDKSAPKGRLILPQQQVIRDILDNGATAIIAREYELKEVLSSINKSPKLVITDSRVFASVAKNIPENMPLTSFSIIFAREKGDLKYLTAGAQAISKLKDGDKVLITEACTHHPQEDDIGRVKIPKWLLKATGKNLKFDHSAGMDFTDKIKDYSLIVHCGGCMINRKAMLSRIEQTVEANVPIVNYGVLISYVNGILERAVEPFQDSDK